MPLGQCAPVSQPSLASIYAFENSPRSLDVIKHLKMRPLPNFSLLGTCTMYRRRTENTGFRAFDVLIENRNDCCNFSLSQGFIGSAHGISGLGHNLLESRA